jgi:hypothetical protein
MLDKLQSDLDYFAYKRIGGRSLSRRQWRTTRAKRFTWSVAPSAVSVIATL